LISLASRSSRIASTLIRSGGVILSLLLVTISERPYIGFLYLELTDEQTEALIREQRNIIQNNRYPLSPRIVALKAVLGMLRPEPAREPLPPLRNYEPPRGGGYRRRS